MQISCARCALRVRPGQNRALATIGSLSCHKNMLDVNVSIFCGLLEKTCVVDWGAQESDMQVIKA